MGLWGIAGVAKARRGEARGEEKGDAVDDMDRYVEGTKPGGARGLTPRRGELDAGVPP